MIDYVPDIVQQAMSSKWSKGSSGPAGDEIANLVAHTLKADGFDASEDGTGRGTPLVPIAPSVAASLTRGAESAGKGGYAGRRQEDDVNLVCFDARQSGVIQYGDKTGPLDTDGHTTTVVKQGWTVRRLTPLECERLQGFPDGYTAIPYRGKPAADGPRYKALGNSMAINCMRWIGRRIEMVNAITTGKRAET